MSANGERAAAHDHELTAMQKPVPARKLRRFIRLS
jgi:hypothetical protein